MTDRVAKILFGTIDSFMSIFSGALFIAAPRFGLESLVPAFAGTGLSESPAALLLVRSFGQLVFGFGLIEYVVMRSADRRIVRMLLGALLVSDLIHLAIHTPFLLTYGGWTGGSIFGIAYEVAMAAGRALYLATKPQPVEAGSAQSG